MINGYALLKVFDTACTISIALW